MTSLHLLTAEQWLWLIIPAVAGGWSAIGLIRKQYLLSVYLLTLSAFLFRFFLASSDGFLYDWDEQYHALVAKHLSEDPLVPALYKSSLLPVDHTRWAHNTIWLHKPPFFLWLIALSIKLFGVFPLAVKLPSVILSSLMVPALYDLTRRLTDRNTAWLAAFLLTFISVPAQLVSGYKNTDHNDVIFSAMLLFSVWTWVRYLESRKVHWALFTGLFSGAAVLTKWATGLFIFLIWGISNLLSAERKDRRTWISLFVGILVCSAIVLPWYVYIFRAFPVEAEYEFSYNALHFTMAIEGHEGHWYYHFTALTDLLGWPVLFLSAAGWFFLLKKRETSTRTLPLLLSVIFFIVFYSVAQTKMPLFLLPLVPFILIGTGHAIMILFRFASGLTERKLIAGSAGILLALLLMDLPSVASRFDPSTPLCWFRGIREHDRKISEEMSKQLPGDKWVIFNFPDNHRAAHMFYTDHVVYRELPPCDSLLLFKRKGYNVAVMKGANTSYSAFRCPEIPLLENSFDEK